MLWKCRGFQPTRDDVDEDRDDGDENDGDVLSESLLKTLSPLKPIVPKMMTGVNDNNDNKVNDDDNEEDITSRKALSFSSSTSSSPAVSGSSFLFPGDEYDETAEVPAAREAISVDAMIILFFPVL